MPEQRRRRSGRQRPQVVAGRADARAVRSPTGERIDEEHVKFGMSRAAVWVAAYLGLAVTPLVFAFVGPMPAPRPFLVELGVGLGFVGIAVLALQFVTTGRFRSIAPVFGADAVLQFHRQAGVVAFALILAHPAVIVLSEPGYLEFFDPRVNFLRALALSAVIPILVLLLVTSLWRERVRLNYERWRLIHGGLSIAVVFIGMVHGVQVGTYLGALWEQGVWVGVLLGVMYLVVHSRVVRPLRMRRRPYRVAEVVEEAGDCSTLVLEADGHARLPFAAGQYGWITLGDSPFRLQQHPFSFSSSACDPRLSFTAKRLGDFTSSLQEVEVGSRAYVEGPYGAFSLDGRSSGAVFIVGGIGVTPAMSILRTMRDTSDERPVTLIYGVPTVAEAPFHEELARLEEELRLQLVYVLDDPPEGWEGASGYVDAELLRQHLPADRDVCEYFICGPEPMMDAAEQGLRQLGVSWRQIYTERFQIV